MFRILDPCAVNFDTPDLSEPNVSSMNKPINKPQLLSIYSYFSKCVNVSIVVFIFEINK